MALLIKVSGKCTTDHISMAGKWPALPWHLDNISGNLLMGAVNAFQRSDRLRRQNTLTGTTDRFRKWPRIAQGGMRKHSCRRKRKYGEGSSRETCAMEPRHLGVKAIIAKSFARIHETNLKKQGMLALTFADPADYDKIGEYDTFSIDIDKLDASGRLTVTVWHSDGTSHDITAAHNTKTRFNCNGPGGQRIKP